MGRQAQAERGRHARVILGAAEAEIANSFAEAARSAPTTPSPWHLRAMNMLYESVKARAGTTIIGRAVQSTAEPWRRGGHHLTGQDRRNEPAR